MRWKQHEERDQYRIMMASLARNPRSPSTTLPPRKPPRFRFAAPATQADALVAILRQLGELRAKNRLPNAAGHVALVRAAADYAVRRGSSVPLAEGGASMPKGAEPASLAFQIALAAVRDAERGGLDLGDELAAAFLKFSYVHPEILPSALLNLPAGSAAPALRALAATAVAEDNLEQLVMLVNQMLDDGMPVEAHERTGLVRLCCQWGAPRLALDVVRRIEGGEADRPSGKIVEAAAWINILTASAEQQYLEGVEAAWERVASASAFTPDEGLILSVLGVAGRWGRPELATKALGALGRIQVRPAEHHVVPLLEAFCRAGQVPEAIKVLCGLRVSGIAPTLATAQPIVAVLSTAAIVDQAYYALEDMHAAGGALDVAALNAVVEASARIGDLQRTRATQTAAASLGIAPDVDTFNLVLSACIAAGHRALGDTLFTEMAAANVDPNATTYERMVILCLSQATYEDAFYYLEKMKAEGHVPPRSVYAALYRKCQASKDPRWRLVLDEARDLGYAISSDENGGVSRGAGEGMSARKAGGREGDRERQAGRRRATDQMVGAKRRNFVATGVISKGA